MEGEAAFAGGGAEGGDAGRTHRPEPSECTARAPARGEKGERAAADGCGGVLQRLQLHSTREPGSLGRGRSPARTCPGLSLAAARLRAPGFGEDARVLWLCNGLCKMVYS